MTPTRPVKLTVTHRFKASAERVFDAWLDPAKARHWLFVTRPNTPLARAEVDARVGGRFCFADLREGEEVEHMGVFLELDRPRRLVLTLSVPKYSANVDRVTVEIAPQDTGCVLTLTHELGPEGEQWRERTTQGWTQLLDLLGTWLDTAPHG